MFTAYYDESGTHDSSPITMLAGFFGAIEGWASLEREWRKVLVKHDLRYVRAKQLFHKQGPYRGWSRRQMDYLWADILYVLQEHKDDLKISKIVLPHEDYVRSYVADGPISKKERLDTPYALCVRVALHFLPMVHHGIGSSGLINFVLEAGHKHSGDALRVFNDLKKQNSYSWCKSIGAMSFGTKTDFPALQAADLIAYWFYKTEMDLLGVDTSEWYVPKISDIETDLAHCGMGIVKHIIQPRDLANLRQNYLAKKKKRVAFDRAHLIARGDSLPDSWDTPLATSLFGLEFSAEELSVGRDQIQHRSRQRR